MGVMAMLITVTASLFIAVKLLLHLYSNCLVVHIQADTSCYDFSAGSKLFDR